MEVPETLTGIPLFPFDFSFKAAEILDAFDHKLLVWT